MSKKQMYWHCNTCTKKFKISGGVCIQLNNLHENPSCPYCGSKNVSKTTRGEYKSFSGQAQKKNGTSGLTLFDFNENKTKGVNRKNG